MQQKFLENQNTVKKGRNLKFHFHRFSQGSLLTHASSKIAAQTVVDGGFMPAGNAYERKQGLVIYYLNADQGPTNPLA